MLGADARLFALLPTVGLCSCVVHGESAASVDPGPGVEAPGLIEIGSGEPLTVDEALARSGRSSLAAGYYEAAAASLELVAARQPDMGKELYFERIDAALGLGDVSRAEVLIEAARQAMGQPDALRSRAVLARELGNARGLGECNATVDGQTRSLLRTDDPLAAWNALRSGLPADHAIPIPIDADAARETLCGDGCFYEEPELVRLEGDNEATLGLVVSHEDGSFTVLPDLLHPVASGCDDEVLFAVEKQDELVRIRAFGERLEPVNAMDWNLVELPEYNSAPHVTPVAGSSSYAYAYTPPSSGYHYSSGSSGYQYGYAYYGCGGGYDGYYYPETCEVHAHVERDVFLDLDRGEVVLDIVRTGERGTALGRVSMTSAPTGPVVEVRACGVSESLSLSYT